MTLFSIVSGFNAYSQLNFSVEEKGNFGEKESLKKEITFITGIEVMDFSWSGILFRNGKLVQYRGFIDDEQKKPFNIVTPDEDEIIKGRFKQNKIIVLTKTGSCWQFDLMNQSWVRLFLRESNTDGESSQSVTDLATSDNITLLLTSIGQVYSYPSLITPPGIKVTQVACGFEHCAFLCDSGFLYSWGGGSRGQLGHGDIESLEEPQEVVALSGLGIVSISAGGWHSCAITSSGDVYSWGWNHHSQLGPHFTEEKSEVVCEPSLVKMPCDDIAVRSASCGSTHTLFLLEDQTVYGCGCNKWCQLGLSPAETTIGDLRLLHKPNTDVLVKRLVTSHWNTAIVCDRQTDVTTH